MRSQQQIAAEELQLIIRRYECGDDLDLHLLKTMTDQLLEANLHQADEIKMVIHTYNLGGELDTDFIVTKAQEILDDL